MVKLVLKYCILEKELLNLKDSKLTFMAIRLDLSDQVTFEVVIITSSICFAGIIRHCIILLVVYRGYCAFYKVF